VREIALHANRLAFNAPLQRDVELIETVRECSKRWLGGARGRYGRLATHRFHLIEAGRYTSALSPDSSLKPDWTMLNYLFSAGRDETDKWLSLNRGSIGHRSSVDLKARFLTPERRRAAPASAGKPAASSRKLAAAAGDIPD
jgi:NTE family protein